MDLLERKILSRLKSGDQNAFEYIFKSFYSPLCLYATDILKVPEVAEEIAQEAFVAFWEKRRKLEINQSLKSYLYSMKHPCFCKYKRACEFNEVKDHGKNY